MDIEQIEERYVKGYDLTSNKDTVQWQNDMEWLLDKALEYRNKYRNLLNAMIDAIDQNNKL